MAIQLDFKAAQINRTVAYRDTAISEDIVDGTYNSTNKLPVTAGVEYRLEIGTAARHFKNGFNSKTGITMLFDIDNDKAVYSEVYDTPTILALPNCLFQPSAASAGECIIKCYVDETSPILHDQAIVSYKGISPEKMGDIFQYYLGDEVGYQLKTKGVYFTFTFDHNGNMWDMSLNHNVI